MDFYKLLHGFVKIDEFVKIDIWISLKSYMNWSKLLHGFIKVVPCVSCPLPNKTRLKFDQEFKASKVLLRPKGVD